MHKCCMQCFDDGNGDDEGVYGGLPAFVPIGPTESLLPLR